LVSASDAFGGRPLRVVCGYRTSSYFQDSRHRQSAAIDFSVIGVRNAELRDYLLTLDQVGVGYYPNSSFVHLDVRNEKTYWIDYAGPGEPPRYRPRKAATASAAPVTMPAEVLPNPSSDSDKIADAHEPTSDQTQDSVTRVAADTSDRNQTLPDRQPNTIDHSPLGTPN
jgi:hypothetical protein